MRIFENVSITLNKISGEKIVKYLSQNTPPGYRCWSWPSETSKLITVLAKFFDLSFPWSQRFNLRVKLK